VLQGHRRRVDRRGRWALVGGARRGDLGSGGFGSPTPALLDPKFSGWGLLADVLTRVVTGGTFDFQVRGSPDWLPAVISPGSPGTSTPEQSLALAQLAILDQGFGRDPLEVFADGADERVILLHAPRSSKNDRAELVVTLTLELDDDSYLKNACAFALTRRIVLPPGPSVSARLRMAIDAQPEIHFGRLEEH
jgi:hypothetical protein